MGIKVNRICDMCGEDYLQSILDSETDVTYPVKLLNDLDMKFICSTCILAIDKLITLMGQENDGRGISCVSAIIVSLNRVEVEDAKRIYMNEGDKIRSYPKIQDWLYKHLGCRLHNNIDCQNTLCKDLKKYNDEKL